MIIYKDVKIKKLLIPQSTIAIDDPLNNIMKLCVALFKETGQVNKAILSSKFAFSDDQAAVVLQRLLDQNLIETIEEEFQLSGKDIDNITNIKILDLKMETITNPHFVLSHQYSSIDTNITEEQDLTTTIIENRRLFSGLNKNIRSIGSKIFVFGIRPGILELDLESKNLQLHSIHKSDRIIEIVEDDEEMNDLIVELKQLTGDSLNNTLLQSISNQLQSSNIDLVIELPENQPILLRFEFHEDAISSDLLAILHWLENNGKWVVANKFKMRFQIQDGWYIRSHLVIDTGNDYISTIFFLYQLLEQKLVLMGREDVLSSVNDFWREFSEFQLDHKLLFDLLWDMPRQQEFTRYIATKLIEEEVLQ